MFRRHNISKEQIRINEERKKMNDKEQKEIAEVRNNLNEEKYLATFKPPEIYNYIPSEDIATEDFSKTTSKSLTDINKIKNKEDVKNDRKDNDISNEHIVMDLSRSLDSRIKAIEQIQLKQGDEDVFNLTRTLIGMYQMSGSKIIENFFSKICTHGKLSTVVKLDIAETLISFKGIHETDEEFEEKQNKIYIFIDSICYNMKDVSNIVYRLKAIMLLMKSVYHIPYTDEYFMEIFTDNTIDCEYRYRSFLSLEREENIPQKEKRMCNYCFRFFTRGSPPIKYEILAGQYILQNKEHLEPLEKFLLVEKRLLVISKDNNVDYNKRADAADVVLSMGSEEGKVEAKSVIEELGKQGCNKNQSMFDNKQNVHNDEVSKSVEEIIEYITCYFMDKRYEWMNWDQLQDILLILANEQYKENIDNIDKIEKIKTSLWRITMDRKLYSKLSITLSTLVIHLWYFSSDSEYKDEIRKRLIEELFEMADTCSSGFVSRIANTISGFSEISVRISYEDQIISSIIGRLNARARSITDTNSIFTEKEKMREVIYSYLQRHSDILDKLRKKIEHLDMFGYKDKLIDLYLSKNKNRKIVDALEEFQELVLEEITLSESEYNNKTSLSLFIRLTTPFIRDELWEEYCNGSVRYIDDVSFDLYFRKGMMNFEGC